MARYNESNSLNNVGGGNSVAPDTYPTFNTIDTENKDTYRKKTLAEQRKEFLDNPYRFDLDTHYTDIRGMQKGAKADEYRKENYDEYGVRFSADMSKQDYEKARAKNQNGWEQFGNFLMQAGVNEVLIGSIKGFSDIADAGINAFNEHNDFTNPISQYLEQTQDNLKKDFEIYRQNPGESFDIADSGWWWDNMVSVATTLSLLIPTYGYTKGASMIGKALGALGKTGNKLNSFGKLSRKLNAAKTGFVNGITSGNKVLAEEIGMATKHGTHAFLSRTAENYQEARETYKNNFKDYLAQIQNMNDVERSTFISNNPEYKDMTNEDIATSIAEEGARDVFINDYWMLAMDYLQFKSLSNIYRNKFNVESTVGTRIAQRNAIDKLLGGTNQIEHNTINGIKNEFSYLIKHPTKSILFSELGEGVEEGFQGIQQQIGEEVGAKKINPYYKPKNLGDYLTDASIYEQAFWGVMGGIVFSGSHQLASKGIDKYNEYKTEKLHDAGKIDDKEYMMRKMSFEKQRTAEINNRKDLLDDLLNKIKVVNDGKNPERKSTIANENGEYDYEDVKSDTEKEILKAKYINDFVVNMTINASRYGNYDLLKEYIENPALNKYIKEQIGEDNTVSQKLSNSLITKMNHVYNTYKSVHEALVNDESVDNQYAVDLAANHITKSKLELEDLNDDISSLESEIANNEDNSLVTDNYRKAAVYNMYKDYLKDTNDIQAYYIDAKNKGELKEDLYNNLIEDLNNSRRLILKEYSSNNKTLSNFSKDINDTKIDVNEFVDEFNDFQEKFNKIFEEFNNATNQITSNQIGREKPNANIQKLVDNLIRKERERDSLKRALPVTAKQYKEIYDQEVSNIKLHNERYMAALNNVVKDYIKNNVGYDAAIAHILDGTAPEPILNAVDAIKADIAKGTNTIENVLNNIKKEIEVEELANKEQRNKTTVNGEVVNPEVTTLANNINPVEEDVKEPNVPSTGGEVNPEDNVAQGNELINYINGKTFVPISVGTLNGRKYYSYIDENNETKNVFIDDLEFAKNFNYKVGEQVNHKKYGNVIITVVNPSAIFFNTETDSEFENPTEFVNNIIDEELIDDEPGNPVDDTIDEDEFSVIKYSTISVVDSIIEAMKELNIPEPGKENSILKELMMENTPDNKNEFIKLLNTNLESKGIDVNDPSVESIRNDFVTKLFDRMEDEYSKLVTANVVFSSTGTVIIDNESINTAIREFLNDYIEKTTGNPVEANKEYRIDIKKIFDDMINNKIDISKVNLIMNNIYSFIDNNRHQQDGFVKYKFINQKALKGILSDPNKFLNAYRNNVEGEEITDHAVRINAPRYANQGNYVEARNKLQKRIDTVIKKGIPVHVGYPLFKTNAITGKAYDVFDKDNPNRKNVIAIYIGDNMNNYRELGILSSVMTAKDNNNDNNWLGQVQQQNGIVYWVSKNGAEYLANTDTLFTKLIYAINGNTEILNQDIRTSDKDYDILVNNPEEQVKFYQEGANLLSSIAENLSNDVDIINSGLYNNIKDNYFVKTLMNTGLLKSYTEATTDGNSESVNANIIKSLEIMAKILFYDKVDTEGFMNDTQPSIDSYKKWIGKIHTNYSQTADLIKQINNLNEGEELNADISLLSMARPITTETEDGMVLNNLNDEKLKFIETQPTTFYIASDGVIKTDNGKTYTDENVANMLPFSMGFIVGEDNGRPILAMFNKMNKVKNTKLGNELYKEIQHLVSAYLNLNISHEELGIRLSNLIGNPKSRQINTNNNSKEDSTNESLFYGLTVEVNNDRISIRHKSIKNEEGIKERGDILIRFERYSKDNKTIENRSVIWDKNKPEAKQKYGILKGTANQGVINYIASAVINNLSFNRTNFAIFNSTKRNTNNTNKYLYKKNGKICIKFTGGEEHIYNNFAHYAVENNIAMTSQSINSEGSYIDYSNGLKNMTIKVHKTSSKDTITTLFGDPNSKSEKAIDISTVRLLSYFGTDVKDITKYTDSLIDGMEPLLPNKIKYINKYFKEDALVDATYNKSTGEIIIYKKGKESIITEPQSLRRLLIHESIHGKIKKNNFFIDEEGVDRVDIINDIYDLYTFTKEALNNAIKSKNITDAQREEYKQIKSKIFDIIDDKYKNKKKVIAEEFICESLSQVPLMKFMARTKYKNDVNVNKAETIMQKIMKFICELFNINLEKNSILAKEFELLNDNTKVIDYTSNNNENTESIVPSINIEQKKVVSLAFDEDEEIDDYDDEDIDDEEIDDDDNIFNSATGTVNYVENSIDASINHNDYERNGNTRISNMNEFVNMFPIEEKPYIADMIDKNELPYACGI